jgi:hypothetical protein
VKLNVLLGGAQGPVETASRAFAHRLRSEPLVRDDEPSRLPSAARAAWRQIWRNGKAMGYTRQAIAVVGEVQQDVAKAGCDPTSRAVVIGKARLEDRRGDIGLAGGDQELPGDSLGTVMDATRRSLAPGTTVLAACTGAVDAPAGEDRADWSLRIAGRGGVPASVALRALTMRQADVAGSVSCLAEYDGWDLSAFDGEVLVNGRSTGWTLVMFRVFDDGPDGIGAAVYPYLTSLTPSGGHWMESDVERIVEALAPLHAPGPMAGMFERCRTNSVMRPLQLVTCDGRTARSQEHLEGLRDLVNLGRLTAIFDSGRDEARVAP